MVYKIDKRGSKFIVQKKFWILFIPFWADYYRVRTMLGLSDRVEYNTYNEAQEWIKKQVN